TNGAWDMLSAGFRMDWEATNNALITFQGDIYHENLGQMSRIIQSAGDIEYTNIDTTAEVNGANLLLRWEQILSHTSDLAVQLYYDYYERLEAILHGKIQTADLDFQHRFGIGSRNEFMWGLGYRFMQDNSIGSFHYYLDPASRKTSIASAFIQDELTVIKEKMRLTMGTKFEENDYTGMEIQPNIRLLLKPSYNSTIWFAISKAIRIPSRTENDSRAIRDVWNLVGLPLYGQFAGTKSFDSEKLIAYELGYRSIFKNLSSDIAFFYNHYSDLRSYKMGESQSSTDPEKYYVIVPFYLQNKMDGESFGGEISLKFNPLEWWQIQTDYSYLKMNMFLPLDSDLHEIDRELNAFAKGTEKESPENQFGLRTTFQIFDNLSFTLNYRWIDEIPQLNVNSYSNLDANFCLIINKQLKLNLIGHNLLREHHLEYIPAFRDIRNAEVERGFYSSLEYEFN
ncbi:TonB-dependent receptor, partial [candidate division KSB1 bacterium]|nr:TonB-dependent receptor [candidate division KSB1 bacterium]